MINAPCILVSYHYLRKSDPLRILTEEFVRRDICPVLIDSGAFSAHRNNVTIDLSEYCDYIDRLNGIGKVFGCIQLDIIGNKKKTNKNLDKMIARGLSPMPVLTSDEDPGHIKNLIEINRKVCVAGGVSKFDGADQWLVARYIDVYRRSKEQALIHALGYTRFPQMLQLPLNSVDSTTFTNGARYASLNWFDREKRILRHRYWVKLVVKHGSELEPEMMSMVRNSGVTYRDWINKSLMCDGQFAFCALQTLYVWSWLCNYALRCGLHLFLSGTLSQLKSLCGVAKHGRSDGTGFDFHKCRQELTAVNELFKSDTIAGTKILCDMMQSRTRTKTKNGAICEV